MSAENRIYTQNPHQVTTSLKLNDIQDNYCMSLELDQSTLAPTTPLEGATLYYGQFNNLSLLDPGLHVLDSSRDWRNRSLMLHIVHMQGSLWLPKAANYDPQTFQVEESKLWYTQTGATAANPPVGFYWNTPNGGDDRYIFAASTTALGLTAGDLAIWIESFGAGGIGDGFLMIHILQYPDAS